MRRGLLLSVWASLISYTWALLYGNSYWPTPVWSLGPDLTLGHDMNAAIFQVAVGTSDFTPGRGRIVLVGEADCSYEDMVRRCQGVGCVGVVVRSYHDLPGRYAWSLFDGSSRSDLRVPLFEVGLSDFNGVQSAISTNPNATFRLTSDENKWQAAVDSDLLPSLAFKVLYQGALALLNLFAAVAAVVKLVKWLSPERRTGRFAIVPLSCLSLHLVASLLRAFYLAYDPTLSTRRLTFLSSSILSTVSAPLNMAATVIIVRFWVLTLGATQQSDHRNIGHRCILVDRRLLVTFFLLLSAGDIVLNSMIGTFRLRSLAYVALSVYYLLIDVSVMTASLTVGLHVLSAYKRELHAQEEVRKAGFERVGTLPLQETDLSGVVVKPGGRERPLASVTMTEPIGRAEELSPRAARGDRTIPEAVPEARAVGGPQPAADVLAVTVVDVAPANANTKPQGTATVRAAETEVPELSLAESDHEQVMPHLEPIAAADHGGGFTTADKSLNALRERYKAKIERLTVLLMVSVGTMFTNAAVLLPIIVIGQGSMLSPTITYLMWGIIYLSLALSSLVEINAF